MITYKEGCEPDDEKDAAPLFSKEFKTQSEAQHLMMYMRDEIVQLRSKRMRH